MKKTYETPSIEKIAFQYRDQVVVASGNYETVCSFHNTQIEDGCHSTVETIVDRMPSA